MGSCRVFLRRSSGVHEISLSRHSKWDLHWSRIPRVSYHRNSYVFQVTHWWPFQAEDLFICDAKTVQISLVSIVLHLFSCPLPSDFLWVSRIPLSHSANVCWCFYLFYTEWHGSWRARRIQSFPLQKTEDGLIILVKPILVLAPRSAPEILSGDRLWEVHQISLNVFLEVLREL